jgi:transposase
MQTISAIPSCLGWYRMKGMGVGERWWSTPITRDAIRHCELLLFMADNSMKPAAHPPYSPDLAPCDFYLFGHVKGRLTGRQFESREDLFEAIRNILTAFPREKLIEVFLKWERKLQP